MNSTAKALWITAPGKAEHRDTPLARIKGDVEIQTLFSGISKGTERLVFSGLVPESEHETMRAPFQGGAFGFPLKYGYSSVGLAQDGALAGRTIFALFPHQSRFAVPQSAVFLVPDDVPAERAILAANMETALNIVWDAGISAGDRVAIVGCGVVGALVGYLAGRSPGTEVTLIDVNPKRANLAAAMGCSFSTPDTAPHDADVVIHASATEAGLATAIASAGLEAKVVEASWYGAANTSVPLGGRFHQRRLKIIGSQVGRIPADRAARWSFGRRLDKALHLLADPCLDALITSCSSFSALPREYQSILSNPETLCHRVRYD